ncbi:hypothetical protein MKX01_009198 [Papaver californicum]|nr:hypothetical protein MKX01_009198 [Papaver californicum]
MGSRILSLVACFLVVLSCSCNGSARKLTSLYKPPPMVLKYHNGKLLEGNLHVSILWYGKFTPTQNSDFFLSLNPSSKHLLHSLKSTTDPSVSHWWENVQTYMKNAQKKQTHIILSKECNKNVTVEGFCMSSCGFHGSNKMENSCPGQCAWPFHQLIYGPQDKPLVAPKGDSIIRNCHNGNCYFQGTADASLEVSSACPGVYGKGAYPGYAGNLLRDTATGGSYNAHGVDGRKYLLPALFKSTTSECSTLV